MSWHAGADLLEAYARGSLDDAGAFSVEAHLLACGRCRAAVAPLVEADRLEHVWAGVELVTDAPEPGPVERILRWLRVPDDVSRLLTTTPSLSLSWVSAMVLVLAFAVIAARQREEGVLAFLVLAPLLPIAGVAAAYTRGLDPAHELALAAPMDGLRLLLVRTVAVLATTVATAAAAALALPGFEWTVAAWLVPALALTSLDLALATFVPIVRASAVLAIVWTSAAVVSARASDDLFAAFRVPVQCALLFAALVAALTVARRRDRLHSGGSP